MCVCFKKTNRLYTVFCATYGRLVTYYLRKMYIFKICNFLIKFYTIIFNIRIVLLTGFLPLTRTSFLFFFYFCYDVLFFPSPYIEINHNYCLYWDSFMMYKITTNTITKWNAILCVVSYERRTLTFIIFLSELVTICFVSFSFFPCHVISFLCINNHLL